MSPNSQRKTTWSGSFWINGFRPTRRPGPALLVLLCLVVLFFAGAPTRITAGAEELRSGTKLKQAPQNILQGTRQTGQQRARQRLRRQEKLRAWQEKLRRYHENRKPQTSKIQQVFIRAYPESWNGLHRSALPIEYVWNAYPETETEIVEPALLQKFRTHLDSIGEPVFRDFLDTRLVAKILYRDGSLRTFAYGSMCSCKYEDYFFDCSPALIEFLIGLLPEEIEQQQAGHLERIREVWSRR